VTDPEVTTIRAEAAGNLVELSFCKPTLEPAAADDFERWMLAELKDGITELLEACAADGDPWPGGILTVPIYVLPSGEYVCGTAMIVDGEPAMH
jgi:hypothetical protein